ncbi:hypothetical protein [Nonomuraea longispora]|uniref:hypothetical protein n=1 Tax=Nonomuraea longispora TaxID=1848320 RepID=UPI001FE87C9C|nr:hypothetical protein [Nonomuraea longispora]
MSFAVAAGPYPDTIDRSWESSMTVTYTFDVFSSLDGFGGADATGPATGASRAPSS